MSSVLKSNGLIVLKSKGLSFLLLHFTPKPPKGGFLLLTFSLTSSLDATQKSQFFLIFSFFLPLSLKGKAKNQINTKVPFRGFRGNLTYRSGLNLSPCFPFVLFQFLVCQAELFCHQLL